MPRHKGISVSAIHYFLMLLLSFAVVASLQVVGGDICCGHAHYTSIHSLVVIGSVTESIVAGSVVRVFCDGVMAAIVFEMPPWPAMAIAATYLLAAFFSPEKRAYVSFLPGGKENCSGKSIWKIPKQSFRLQQNGQLNPENLLQNLGFNKNILQQQLSIMRTKGWMEKGNLTLTEKGKEEAQRLVRASTAFWENLPRH
ncbi:MAG: hypothetical protein R2788_20855 [Saprospiraceae bacterium]